MKKYQPHKSESVYDLIKLPLKYHKFYSYIGQVCEVIKARAPKVKIEDKEGRFYLTQGKNVPTFEGKFRSGVRVTHTVSSEIMKVELPNGNIFEINIVEDMNELDEYIKDLVSKAFERLNKCLEMNNE